MVGLNFKRMGFQFFRITKRSGRLLFFLVIITFIVFNLLLIFLSNENTFPTEIVEHLYSSDIDNFEKQLLDDTKQHDENMTIALKPILDLGNEVDQKIKYSRKPVFGSPFKLLSQILKVKPAKIEARQDIEGESKDNPKKINSVKDGFALEDWKNPNVFSVLDQCKILIDALYDEEENWNNIKNFEIKKDDEKADELLSIYAERLRIYNYCFLFNNLIPSNIFNNTESKLVDISQKYASRAYFTEKSFQAKMFPFLKTSNDRDIFLPKIIDLNTMQPISLNITTPTKEHNDNFWQNWSKISKGKGIITTFPKWQCNYFLRGLRTLKYVKNKLPIQIVVNEDEFSDALKQKLSRYAKETNQQLYLVTFSNLLNENIEKYATGYMNKFYASLFNTFEEFVLFDADAVTFLNPQEYFDFAEYKSSGLYIGRDRNLKTRVSESCINSFRQLEPTFEEINLLNSSIFYTVNAMNESSPNGNAYRSHFVDREKHIAESSLVTINKKKSLPGILMATMLYFTSKIKNCSHGDKEFFWLGPLYAGVKYEFEPNNAALIGFPKKEYDEEQNYIKTTLCDIHISHIRNGKLLWTNGYLSRSKNRKDKKQNPRMRANGFLIPGKKDPEWKMRETDLGNMYCAAAVEENDVESIYGYVGRMDDEAFQNFEDISIAWNKELN